MICVKNMNTKNIPEKRMREKIIYFFVSYFGVRAKSSFFELRKH